MTLARILSGHPVAEAVYAELREALRTLPFLPSLRVIRLGEDPASVAYVRLKDKKARELGLLSQVEVYPEDTPEEVLLARIGELNQDPGVDGILVQLPLPRHIRSERVLEAISPLKDVDGFHPVNVGRLWSGGEGLFPCTPLGILRLLRHYGVALRGKEVVVLGRSNIVGRPLAGLLLREDATVTVAHSRTQGLPEVARRAEVLVVAVGRPHLVRRDWVRPGAVVVDVGVNRVEGRLLGDVHPEVAEVAGALTPVPGGVGPMTVAMLMANTVRAALLRRHGPPR
ncbi:bifunctional 5,10-methylenetetrahydrofolate dehydrogenase/5,10-methenyltetrahydrofolate cyclohydrolase [Thermus thermamylovorans]|uniref:Bifunctional protein FolD n=1 Tax=Thermus thermamylovorans TaxID=2509362 RepID=A0A4Q9B780_9DEIN|nr:tetrahydrofolate dehydrogenase/cyclohydrolase catalytic domain-containing protein [Thermus thermamylovorans]TBH21897.1 bifunctional 5,10-methylene-tetrahydrofolate dehydrogenase/5,10-methylene-tetrahydrofolate cyclohydrolase [Thermus thermamylovorans]